MGPRELRVGLWLGARLCLKPLKVRSWLGLGLGLGRPGLGGRLSRLWSVLIRMLLLRLVPGVLLHLMSGLQVRLRLGRDPRLGLRLSLGWSSVLSWWLNLRRGSGLQLRLRLGRDSGLELSLELGWGPALGLELRLQ